jgi:hypothetical protein
MWHDGAEGPVHLNWIAILSLTGSIVGSLAIWVGLFRTVQYFVK